MGLFDFLGQSEADRRRIQETNDLLAIIKSKDTSPEAKKDAGFELSNRPRFKAMADRVRQRQGIAADQPVSLFGNITAPTIAQQTATRVSELPGKEKDVALGLAPKPPTDQDLFDELQDIDSRVAQGNLTIESAGVQKRRIISSRPGAFKNIDIDALIKSPLVKLSATLGNVDPALVSKSSKTKIEGDIKEGLESITRLVEIMSEFDRDFLTIQGKIKGKLQKIGDLFNRPEILGTEFLTKQSGFIQTAKDAFLRFRKFITGVAGGIPEFREIAKAFPDIEKNSPAEFISKGASAIESGMKAINLLVMIKNEGLEVTKEMVEEKIKQLNIKDIPLDLPRGFTVEDVINSRTPQETLGSRIAALKKANTDGIATVANTPNLQNTPPSTADKLRFDKFNTVFEANKPKDSTMSVQTLSQTHPQSMQIILGGVETKQLTPADLKNILGAIETNRLTDAQVLSKLKAGLGQ